MSMDKYLEDVEDHRRQLNNMNNPTSDADIASVITTGPIASSLELSCTLDPVSAVAGFQHIKFCCGRVLHTDPARRCRIC
ncbi:hypothetical protein PC117_g18974 [Phytophthora cactorum]|uniref:Uncharacterized protein n=1 Tax=Phytophthora cactorum TaxID=29920 RepID=A0A8T1BWG9_9STRA|nr:hypothetical protein PC117_g18974 [Phytophthora cactorum]